MSLELLSDVWSEIISPRLDTHNHYDAAEELVAYLVDLNYQPSEIREYFHGDRNVLKALKEFDKNEDDEIEELDFENNYNSDDY
jgi:hypothetical protein